MVTVEWDVTSLQEREVARHVLLIERPVHSKNGEEVACWWVRNVITWSEVEVWLHTLRSS